MNLHIKKISLFNFRNYTREKLELEAKPVVLTGHNGAGKTNILEAVSLLTPTRGLRAAKLREINSEWSVSASIQSPLETSNIITGYVDGKRITKIDGKTPKTQGELSEKSTIIWLTPQMDGFFIGSAGDRRKFLDRITQTFEPTHIEHLLAYEKAVKERNKLLKTRPNNDAWLSAIEMTIARMGTAIAASRIHTVDKLNAITPNSAFPNCFVEIIGDIETSLHTMPAVDAEQKFAEMLRKSRGQDAFSGRTNIGVHRSDIAVYFEEKPARLCSTGEQKALLIGLILSYAHAFYAARGYAPILLLDEVIAHLDNHRRAELFKELSALQSQVWLTGINRDDFSDIDGQFFCVKNGEICK